MIITKTPFRASFGGGGTDLKEYYSKYGGAVLSTAITKYMYIAVHPYFENRLLLKYSKTESVPDAYKVEHPIIREALKLTSVLKGVEITSISDIPSGTGLGTSSSFTVGLLNSLYAFQGKNVSAKKLAEEACEIEIERLKEPIGKQDQYAAAYGGINLIEFHRDEAVSVKPVIMSKKTRQELESNLLLFYTGSTRTAGEILKKQKKELKDKKDKYKVYDSLKNSAYKMFEHLKSNALESFGKELHNAWMIKKKASNAITNGEIDRIYSLGLKNGALGGKLLGAGGGGFMLFYVPEEKHEKIRNALRNYRELNFNFESQGSKIIYVGE